jgi:hypothetical protein
MVQSGAALSEIRTIEPNRRGREHLIAPPTVVPLSAAMRERIESLPNYGPEYDHRED